MRTAAYKVDVESDRRRRGNVQGTFFFNVQIHFRYKYMLK